MNNFKDYLDWCNENNLKPQYASSLFLFIKLKKSLIKKGD